MKIYDITRIAQEAPLYPGDEPMQSEKLMSIDNGDDCELSVYSATGHIGTHADAFSHYLGEGHATIDKMPLENYLGPCRVISVPSGELIRMDDILGRFGGVTRLVLRSGGNSFLCEEAAEYIAERGVKLLVTDAVSVGPDDNEESIHTILFRGGVAVIENAVLSHVPDGDYIIMAAPVKIGGGDAAPVRAVLLAQ